MTPSYTPRKWHLVATGLIALFGAIVLWMMLNPRVTDDYRSYYIDRTSSCFPRLISFYYPLGAPVSFVKGRNGYDRDTIRWCGFMPVKNDGIKSFGDYGVLKLKFPLPDDDLLLTFSSWANTGTDKPARDVGIVVNGERVGKVTFTNAKRVNGRFVIPRSVAKLGDGALEIRFEVPRIAPAGTNSEPVTLQVRLEAVRLVPLSKAPPPPTTPLAVPSPPKPPTEPSRWGKQRGGVSPASV
ncbi:MAG: hypothetical protein ABIQ30_07080 [Devosia sp.]